MTLQERLKASAKELVRLLEEADIRPVDVKLDNGKAFEPRELKQQDREDSHADASEELLLIAGRVDRYLQKYSAKKALRILEICKSLVTLRIGVGS